MTVPDLPAIHHITVDGEDHLATNDGYRWEEVGDGDSWAVGGKLVTDHGEVIPAGPVDRLVQLPEIGEAVRLEEGWEIGALRLFAGRLNTLIGREPNNTAKARKWAESHLLSAAEFLAIIRAIDAEQAKPPTARERLLVEIAQAEEAGETHLGHKWSTADLREALGEQP